MVVIMSTGGVCGSYICMAVSVKVRAIPVIVGVKMDALAMQSPKHIEPQPHQHKPDQQFQP